MLARLHPLARFLPAVLAVVLVACGGAASPTSAPIGAPAAARTAAPATAPTAAAIGQTTQQQIPQADQSLQQPVAQATAAPAAEPTAAPAAEANAPQPPVAAEPLPPTAAPQVIQVNPFVRTSDDHLSTFALDVDTGSYTAARNYLNAGQLPPAETARVEEFVNYFHYDYPAPEQDAFGIYVEAAPSPFGQRPGTQIVRVGIQGRRIDASQRKDAALTFVIDASGSMDRPDRLPLVKESLKLLVSEMRESDTIAIVVFGSESHVVLNPTSAAQRDTIAQAIDALGIEGATNLEDGLRLGYDLAAHNFKPGAINRVILCSDGEANVGATGPDSILQTIHDNTAQGVAITTVGFGMGDYNDGMLERLADAGNGNYAFVDTLDAARRIFVENLTGTLQVIAKDAKVQVDFNPAVVGSYRLLGYENRAVADSDFRNDTVDAGEVGAGHSVTALYEVHLTEQGSGTALTVQMRYADPKTGEVREIQRPFASDSFGRDFAAASPRFQQAVAVAAFAEQLRGSAYAQDRSLSDVYAIAERIAPQLANDNDVQEFAQLVAKAMELKQ